MYPLVLVAVTTVLFVSSLLVSIRVHNDQPTPYMDEIFHVPQAQSYCRHDMFRWDPMITTPPGLYLTSLVLLLPLKLAAGSEFCTVFALRFTNIVLMLGNFYVSSLIAIKLAGPCDTKARTKLIVSSAAMSLLPVLYFFTFLYYTDPGTVLFLQIMYLYSLFDRHYIAAIFGAVAVLYRQTSIVWLFMVAGCKALDIADNVLRANGDKPESLSCTVSRIVAEPVKQARLVFEVGMRVLYDCAGYILVGLSFVGFVVINGSIALGDKTSHEVVVHVPQLGYFLLFTLAHAAPYLLLPSILMDFSRSLLRRPFLYALIVLASILCVQNFTYAHRYLLADNRHFPFYIWGRLLGKSELVRQCLIPFYLYAGYAVLHRLQHKTLSWRLLFCLCVVAATVPQKLLEFRYFIFPYMFFRMQLRDVRYWQVLIELATNIALNTAVMWLFLNRTFTWEGDVGVQRFMW